MRAWEERVTAALAAADARIRLLRACTPTNLTEELSSLQRAFVTGQPRAPQFAYRRVSHEDGRRALLAIADQLERRGDDLADLYAARARELALEAHMCSVAGTAQLAVLARERFPRAPDADELADAWTQAHPAPEAKAHLSDDEGDARSLIRRLKQEVGRHRLPVRVVAADDMIALAATGPGVIAVRRGVWMSRTAVERTVLHEIEGHARPRSRARGILAVGTAEGSDGQEGRAIALEEAADLLDAHRRRELGLRHRAALAVRAGAELVETVRSLDTEPMQAVRLAVRAHRGGGLGREISYINHFLHFRRASAAARAVMAAGRASAAAAERLSGMSHPVHSYHDEMVTNPVHV